MKTPLLFDASAILAMLQGEPGGELVHDLLLTGQGQISAANLTEVITRSLDRGVAAYELQRIITDLELQTAAVTAEDGAQAGWLRPVTRKLGLSLGDRLCLATAQRLHAQVITADRPWLDIATELGVQINCIRPDRH